MIWKELRVSVLCGIVLAVAGFIKIYVVDYLVIGTMDVFDIPTVLVICVTLAVTVIVAKIVGCVLPVFADKVGLDPAVMASPFITTIVDALSLLVYFKAASVLLGF